ncbi:hypothetical protein H2198_004391 [Neophaeococcomyces mojaviensis]|uniref:Uncharacterized protein n=1 Tax=Neophaeococcomyces mojaviensis TaxID=3383035 RepID=A0ACC3A9A1_9EURO|nr:hypothetical protein H2198_004391 [Knufia sp. JES_112]
MLARLMQDHHNKPVRKGSARAGGFRVRLHSPGAEKSIVTADANAAHHTIKTSNCPCNLSYHDVVEEALSEMQHYILTAYQRSHQEVFADVFDKRGKELELSVGHCMLQVAGVKGFHEDDITDPDDAKYEHFRERLMEYAEAADMDKQQREELKTLTTGLYIYVLQKILSISGTCAGINHYKHPSTLKDLRVIIVFDEFSRMREDDPMPI